LSDPIVPAKSSGTLLKALAVFGERRSLVMLALGFAAGLPNLLIFDTLSLWLREAGLSLSVIGFFSLATLAYSFKFLWAPLVDRSSVPLLTGVLGHRRSWMIVCQSLIMLGLWLIAGVDPAKNLPLMAAFAVLVGFSSATQDIVIDAWRIEVSEVERQGVMAAAYQWGYRLAVIVAGALPLILAEALSWHVSYACMSALMLIGMLAVLAAPREAQHTPRPVPVEDIPVRPWLESVEWVGRLLLLITAALCLGSGLAADTTVLDLALNSLGLTGLGEAATSAMAAKDAVWFQLLLVILGLALVAVAALPIPGTRTLPGAYLSSAMLEPLVEFFRRHAGTGGLILALICLYRLPDFVLNIMNPFYGDLGFSKIEIAEVRKVFGVVMSMLGVFAGGLAVARLGLIRALVIGALAGPLSNLVFAWLATQGHQLSALFVAIGVDNIASGFAGTCLIAYMSSLTSSGFTATQYALFSSLYALPGKLIASQSGRIVEWAAHAADRGGLTSSLIPLFSRLPSGTLATAAAKTGVSPAALGSGYVTFFFYSTLLGAVAIVLVIILARLSPKPAPLPS